MNHTTAEELQDGLGAILDSPRNAGILEMIVRRPAEDQREVLEIGELTFEEGLAGDRWNQESSMPSEDCSPDPDMQVAVINARYLDLIAGSRDRWPLSGDQLVVDMDLSLDNLPAGTQLSIGDARVEVTNQPHTGCQKFAARYGKHALRMTATEEGGRLRLRGMYVRVVSPGTVRTGDRVLKVSSQQIETQ